MNLPSVITSDVTPTLSAALTCRKPALAFGMFLPEGLTPRSHDTTGAVVSTTFSVTVAVLVPVTHPGPALNAP